MCSSDLVLFDRDDETIRAINRQLTSGDTVEDVLLTYSDDFNVQRDKGERGWFPFGVSPDLDALMFVGVQGVFFRSESVGRSIIALTGLNPHAGEDGAMGREEIEIIRPAIEQMKREGLSVRGPEPADTLFHERARSGYDAAVCMYHDQALIPIKTLDFHGTVNITLGLPFVRTSPDHGTAFEIAGTGVANADSLIAALKTASAMARRRRGVGGLRVLRRDGGSAGDIHTGVLRLLGWECKPPVPLCEAGSAQRDANRPIRFGQIGRAHV